jgi:RNA polymerase sigma-70 factor (ECF subfamily)
VDPSLIERVRRGEPDALGAFFDRFFDQIYRLAFRVLGDRALAEDAAQDVCYRIQKAAPRLDPARDPTPFLLTTTMNVCRSLWRSSGHRMRRASTPWNEEQCVDHTVSRDDAPDEALAARERRRSVASAVQELDVSMREVVVLHDYHGMDHKEIGTILGLSHDTVRKRYSRALAILAVRLKPVIE